MVWPGLMGVFCDGWEIKRKYRQSNEFITYIFFSSFKEVSKRHIAGATISLQTKLGNGYIKVAIPIATCDVHCFLYRT